MSSDNVPYASSLGYTRFWPTILYQYYTGGKTYYTILYLYQYYTNFWGVLFMALCFLHGTNPFKNVRGIKTLSWVLHPCGPHPSSALNPWVLVHEFTSFSSLIWHKHQVLTWLCQKVFITEIRLSYIEVKTHWLDCCCCCCIIVPFIVA